MINKKETESPSMPVPQLSVDTVDDPASDNRVTQPNPVVNTQSMQGGEDYSRMATAPMGEAQVVERASQLTAEGKRKATAADFDGILQELGEVETLLAGIGLYRQQKRRHRYARVQCFRPGQYARSGTCFSECLRQQSNTTQSRCQYPFYAGWGRIIPAWLRHPWATCRSR